jgi:hypothetical protein
MELGEVGELRNELRRRLDMADAWLAGEPSLGVLGGTAEGSGNEVLDREGLAAARSTIRQLKVRAASSLINVAFVGGYSSGKSFLISGLQNRLEYEPVVGDNPVEVAFRVTSACCSRHRRRRRPARPPSSRSTPATSTTHLTAAFSACCSATVPGGRTSGTRRLPPSSPPTPRRTTRSSSTA